MLMNDQTAPTCNHKHWRAFHDKNGWKGAPTLEFPVFFLTRLRERVAEGRDKGTLEAKQRAICR